MESMNKDERATLTVGKATKFTLTGTQQRSSSSSTSMSWQQQRRQHDQPPKKKLKSAILTLLPQPQQQQENDKCDTSQTLQQEGISHQQKLPTFTATKRKGKLKSEKSSSKSYYTTMLRNLIGTSNIPGLSADISTGTTNKNKINKSNCIPIEILPLHIQCLQTCTTFIEEYNNQRSSSSSEPLLSLYQTSTNDTDDRTDDNGDREPRNISHRLSSLSNVINQNPNQKNNNNDPLPILERLFHQMDENANTVSTTISDSNSNNNDNKKSNGATNNFNWIQSRMNTAISSWLQSIHQYIRNQNRSSKDKSSRPQTMKQDSVPDDVAITVTKHLLHVILQSPQHHTTKTTGSNNCTGIWISQKRAATLMMYQLLQKSASSRQYFFCHKEDSITKVMDPNNIMMKKSSSSSSFKVTATTRGRAPKNTKLLLLTWMDTISSFVTKIVPSTNNHHHDTNTNNHHNIYNAGVALQQESLALLQSLQQQFQTFYPTLSVAVQRFQQQQLVVTNYNTDLPPFIVSDMSDTVMGRTGDNNNSRTVPPPATTATTTTNYHIEELRQLRDIAMRDSNKLDRRIRALLQQAYTYLDQLVPRFVNDQCDDNSDDNVVRTTNTTIPAKRNHIENDDDDANSIDWEDGDANEETNTTSSTTTTMDQISHLEAVEHTIATIQSGVLYLQEDQMNIDFTLLSSSSSDTMIDRSVNAPDADHDTDTKQKLQRIIDQLYMIHHHHLSIWIYALTHADQLRPKIESVAISSAYRHMTHQIIPPAIPLVRMLPSEMKRQKQITQTFVELHNELHNVLRLSKQLGITITQQ